MGADVCLRVWSESMRSVPVGLVRVFIGYDHDAVGGAEKLHATAECHDKQHATRHVAGLEARSEVAPARSTQRRSLRP